MMEDPKQTFGKPEGDDRSPGSLEKPPIPSKDTAFSIRDLSPAYPKYRDPLIKGVAVVILVIILGVGYGILGGHESPFKGFKGFKKNPLTFFTRLLPGYGLLDTCESFIRDNDALFRFLGRDIKLSVIREEVQVTGGEKKARIVLRAEGSAATELITFFLEKRKGTWGVVTVAARDRSGKYRTVYPAPGATRNKI